MKFLTVMSIFSATALAGRTWYDATADVTCSGDQDGNISCESGHLNDAPEVNVADLQSRDIHTLDKRLSCGISVGPVDGCLLHCFAIGYCNSFCDDKGTCNCRCMDKSGICTSTTCS